MKKISLIVMSCIIACGLLANHGIVKGGEMSPKVEDTVSIDKKITDSQWLSNNSDMLEVDTAGEDSVVNVVAYFCKGDTCEYWIYENEWKVNGKDTVKTLDVMNITFNIILCNIYQLKHRYVMSLNIIKS